MIKRNQAIIKTSVIGIAANTFLCVCKAIVGVLSGSIAIILDAVNNLSDSLSSIITIIGIKLSERPADSQHPFGHGRIEYLSAIIISIIVITAGIMSLIESVKKIFVPTDPCYTTVTLIVIIVAIIVKLVLGRYVKIQGRKFQSDALFASGVDAIFDAVVTLSTLISIGIMLLWGVNLDGIFGTLISFVIIKAGIGMLRAPVNQLLGTSFSKELYDHIVNDVMTHPEVSGVYDIIMNYYGPQTITGSMHINVADKMTACEIHGLTRAIAKELFQKYGIIATIGIYAIHTEGALGALQKQVMQTVRSMEHVIQAHGFYFYQDQNLISIDVITDNSIHDTYAFAQAVRKKLLTMCPGHNYHIVIDHNYTEQGDLLP